MFQQRAENSFFQKINFENSGIYVTCNTTGLENILDDSRGIVSKLSGFISKSNKPIASVKHKS
jgi:hypothetical protein